MALDDAAVTGAAVGGAAAGDTPVGGAAAGDTAADDAVFEEWRARRARDGVRVDVLDLYALAASRRGIAPEDLPREERQALADRALAVIWPGFERVGPRRGSGPVVLVDSDPAWAARYARWDAALHAALGAVARRVAHVGSTAVPGLCAKPIVDVLVTVAVLEDEAAYVEACASIGLELHSRDDEHRFFVNRSPTPIDTHVHVCGVASPFERDHLLFRDYLRSHHDARDDYAAMKREVAARWGEDRMGYTYAKSECILSMLERAEAWAASTSWTLGGGA